MTNEQKRIVGDLRMLADEAKSDMPIICGISTRSADRIEHLADEFHHEVECKALKDDLIDRMAKEFEQVKRERDAAIVDIAQLDYCDACAHNCENKYCECNDYDCDNCKEGCACKRCVNGSLFEWRGPCKENGGEEDGKAD